MNKKTGREQKVAFIRLLIYTYTGRVSGFLKKGAFSYSVHLRQSLKTGFGFLAEWPQGDPRQNAES